MVNVDVIRFHLFTANTAFALISVERIGAVKEVFEIVSSVGQLPTNQIQ